MEKIRILGGTKLSGTVRVQGSKNAALPILAATLLTRDSNFLINCPKITDVHGMLDILGNLGCGIGWREQGVTVDSRYLKENCCLSENIGAMRSSLCLLGALLGRCKRARISYPGGCVIGARPIDLHQYALEQMGVQFWMTQTEICAEGKSLHGAEIFLPFPSVGATENVILAATCAKGKTVLHGAAREPEIVALCAYLNRCGGCIRGAGTSTISIAGVNGLKGREFRIPADRIVAGTYLMATVAVGGNVYLKEAPCRHMKSVIHMAERMGASCVPHEKGIYVRQEGRPLKLPYLYTAPYPGIPTDLQSIILSVRCVGEGECRIEERIFENRFRTLDSLASMGADVRLLNPRVAMVRGVDGLYGTALNAKELRGGAALVVAGVVARGESEITGVSYIERGYENICRDLRELGARIISE